MTVSDHDTNNAEKNIFISFRKSLKKLGTDEYRIINTSSSPHITTKNILMSIRKQARFDGCIAKYDRILDTHTFPKLLAETLFTMFKILCSMNVEYDTSRRIYEIAGVVNDVSRGTPAICRLHSAVNTLVMIWREHAVFQLLNVSIYSILEFSRKTLFLCNGDFDLDDSDDSDDSY